MRISTQRKPDGSEMTRAGVAADAPMLEVRGVRAGYGQIEVVHGVDMSLPAGGILAVLGPNGAGKSTLLRCITGTHPVIDGEIRLAGRRVNGANPVELARRGVCLVPEGRGIFPNLTVRENLQMVTYSGVSRAKVEERAYAVFPKLGERRTQFAGTMSGGEQQMLAVARAVACEPALLLLDELSMGLAPLIVEQLYEVVRQIAATGVTVLLVEQFAAAVLDVADTALVMVGGEVVLSGAPHEVRTDLAAVYLGGKPVNPELAASPALTENPVSNPKVSS